MRNTSEYLQQSRRHIRAFLHTLSWQKIADMYAFNQDGRADFYDYCGCLLGMASSDRLHTDDEFCWRGDRGLPCHYLRIRSNNPLAVPAEEAYSHLGYKASGNGSQCLRAMRLHYILKAELRRRARVEMALKTPQDMELVSA